MNKCNQDLQEKEKRGNCILGIVDRVANKGGTTKEKQGNDYIKSQGGGNGERGCDQEGTHMCGFWDASKVLFTWVSGGYKRVLLFIFIYNLSIIYFYNFYKY